MQRSYMVNYVLYGYLTWSEEYLIYVYDDNDLHGDQNHQRSNMVNCVLWSEESLMQVYDNDDDL